MIRRRHFAIAGLCLNLTGSAFGADIVITEVMANPVSESKGEFVELYNAGDAPVDLDGWTLGDLKDINDTITDYTGPHDTGSIGTVLAPGAYALVVDPDYDGMYNDQIVAGGDPARLLMLTVKGDKTLGNGLGNSSDLAYIEKDDVTIDTFEWTASAGGDGISWERKRIDLPVEASNLSPSVHPDGSTPGSRNSTSTDPPDIPEPEEPEEPTEPEVPEEPEEPEVPEEPEEPEVPEEPEEPTEPVEPEEPEEPTEPEVPEEPTEPVDPEEPTEPEVPEEPEEPTEPVDPEEPTEPTEPTEPAVPPATQEPMGDAFINEIMFNPGPNRSEWIELHNRGGNEFDLSGWSIRLGHLERARLISNTGLSLESQGYLVIAHDAAQFRQTYPSFAGQLVTATGGWERLRNGGARLLLLDASGSVIHEAEYDEESSPDPGRSAELVNPDFEPQTWGPSASAQGGTPGQRNSLYIAHIPRNVSLHVSNNPFSPDGDSHEDVCLITVELPATHGILHAMVFDINGRFLKTLIDQTAVASRHVFTWDGTDQHGRRLPVGPYILYVEQLLPTLNRLTASKHLVVIASSR